MESKRFATLFALWNWFGSLIVVRQSLCFDLRRMVIVLLHYRLEEKTKAVFPILLSLSDSLPV